MPRKTKENEEILASEKKSKVKTAAKISTVKKATTEKVATTTKKATAKKAITNTKKTTTKNTTEKVTKTAKKTTTKKATKTAKTASTKKKIQKNSALIEYYDLPEKYNQTTVKVLAQTPKTLFIYWEISDDDIENYKKQYGENFFEITKPILIIHNDTLNYSFEVEINDFANSWYLHVNDSKSDYRIELGRRPIQYNENIKSNYIYITSSNKIESPNDHILFNNVQKMVYFRNVKTNQEIQKPFSSLSFMRNMGRIYDIYDLYKDLYKNEDNLEVLSNPSSNFKEQ